MAQAPFDASRDFTVRAMELLAAGRAYVAGDPFDTASVPVLVLRRLYNTHQIGYADDPLKGKARVDPLLHKPKRDPLDHDGNGRKGGMRKPTIDEMALADKLVEANTKPQLLEMAKDIEGVRADMNKKAIALAIVRTGLSSAEL